MKIQPRACQLNNCAHACCLFVLVLFGFVSFRVLFYFSVHYTFDSRIQQKSDTNEKLARLGDMVEKIDEKYFGTYNRGTGATTSYLDSIGTAAAEGAETEAGKGATGGSPKGKRRHDVFCVVLCCVVLCCVVLCCVVLCCVVLCCVVLFFVRSFQVVVFWCCHVFVVLFRAVRCGTMGSLGRDNAETTTFTEAWTSPAGGPRGCLFNLFLMKLGHCIDTRSTAVADASERAHCHLLAGPTPAVNRFIEC